MTDPKKEARELQEFLGLHENNAHRHKSSLTGTSVSDNTSETIEFAAESFSSNINDSKPTAPEGQAPSVGSGSNTAKDGQEEDIAPIPNPLRMVQLQQGLIAVVLFITAIACSILFKEVKFLSIILLSLYFVYMLLSLEIDWRKGKINQNVVACTHVIARTRTTQVICRDTQRVYNYFLPDKKSGFVEGYTYIVWTRSSNPKAVLAYQPL